MNLALSQTIALQQQASNPQNSVWVFASAGSGKTKILTDRVLRILLDGNLAHKILCLTFTKVAATEMQNRINGELANWVICDDEELKNKLTSLNGKSPTTQKIKEARTLFVKILDSESKIKIQTIHSFCQSLIKIFPFEAGINPNFEILEPNSEKLLLKESQKEVLKKARTNEFIKSLVTEINSKTHEESFLELVSILLNKKEEIIFLKEQFFGIESLIDVIFKNFSIPKNSSEDEIFREFLGKIDQNNALKLASSLLNSSSAKNNEIGNIIKKFFDNPQKEDFISYKRAFFTQDDSPRKIYSTEAKDESVLSIIDEQRELIHKFDDKINSIKICNDTALLLRFVDQILENYSNLKRKNSLLDYNDLIVETNKLLMNPEFANWVKMKMDGSFDHILVDESQDTNHQQWNIIKSLSEDFFSGLSASESNRSIFIVGDEKQSIYSFQGAEANISKDIFEYFSKITNQNLQKIELTNSFRSSREVLKAVDRVFQDQKRQEAITKTSDFKNHNPIRNITGKVEIWPQITSEKKEKEEKNYNWKIDFSNNEEEKEQEILARKIAQKIAFDISSKRSLENRQTPLKYGDFMILLRNRTNGFDRNLIKFFNEYNIPFSSQSRIKFSENLLIQDLLSLAKFILLPEDDLNLACLLKSPIFEINEDDLLEICLIKNKEKTSIYQSLSNLNKYKNIKYKLDELIEKSKNLNCFEFFHYLLRKQDYQKIFLSYFGHESLEIIEKFLLFLADFSKKFSPNLQKLLEFIEEIDPEISLASDEENRVKITTIHSAKGLQAPIVIVPDCCYNFNQLLSAKEKISWVNFGNFDLPIWCSKKSDENNILKAHRKIKVEEAKEEYLRLLYVAMTRAEDELYISGFGNAKDPESWYEVVKNSIPEASKPLPEIDIEIQKEVKSSANIAFDLSLKDKSKNHFIETTEELEEKLDQHRIKGKIIHKILEIFGKNYKEDKKWLLEIAKKILKKEKLLTKEIKDEINDLILRFIESSAFKEIFSGELKCEAEVSYNKNLYRIDLLSERKNELLIIDYKSDETATNPLPQQYQKQLLTYKAALKEIYPNKKIKCAIFWIKSMTIQYLESEAKEQLDLF